MAPVALDGLMAVIGVRSITTDNSPSPPPTIQPVIEMALAAADREISVPFGSANPASRRTQGTDRAVAETMPVDLIHGGEAASAAERARTSVGPRVAVEQDPGAPAWLS